MGIYLISTVGTGYKTYLCWEQSVLEKSQSSLSPTRASNDCTRCVSEYLLCWFMGCRSSGSVVVTTADVVSLQSRRATLIERRAMRPRSPLLPSPQTHKYKPTKNILFLRYVIMSNSVGQWTKEPWASGNLCSTSRARFTPSGAPPPG